MPANLGKLAVATGLEKVSFHSHSKEIPGLISFRMDWLDHITICKIDSQWEFAVWLRKLKQGLCINLEGWDGEGNGTPLQYSSLENPMDGGAW